MVWYDMYHMSLGKKLYTSLLLSFLTVFLLMPQFSHAAGVPFNIDLEYSMRGKLEVRELQDYLRSFGNFNHATTGNFLDITLAGVKAWQIARCVPATGYFGPISRKAAMQGSLCNASSSITTSTTSTPVPTSSSGNLVIDGKAYIQTTNGLVQRRGGKPRSPSVPAISVSVSPSSATVYPFATTSFTTSILNATDESVTWSTSGGSISSLGVFTAPSPSATSTYTITATSNADTAQSGTATITVPPIVVSVSGAAATTLGGSSVNFSASVINATSSTVTWSTSGGSISTNGLFSAPGVTATTTYTIIASSTIDSARAGTATIEVTPNANFVGWWKLDEGTGTTALDSSGHDNHGTWSGTPSGDTGYYDTNATSTFAYSGSFSSGDDIVTIPNINIGDARTITFWAYIPNLSGTTELVSKSSAGQGVEVIINSGTIQFWVMGSSATYAEAAPGDIRLNDWNYITATYDGPNSTTRVYINGQASGNTGTAPNTIGEATNLYFGTWNSGGRQFVGKLNDIRMYTQLLNAGQVEDLYLSF